MRGRFAGSQFRQSDFEEMSPILQISYSVRLRQVIDSLDDARAAASRQAWRSAYAAYAEVDAQALTAGDLESYGEAAWWSGKLDEAIAHRERAYAALHRRGRHARRCAHGTGRELGSQRSGLVRDLRWLVRECPTAARRAARSTRARPARTGSGPDRRCSAGSWRRRCELFDGVYELATRVGDRDVQMLALSGKGRAHIKAGEIDKGLALLDEATASAMCGDLRAHSAGLVYCITISSCQDVGDYRRAAEWTEVANRWCDKLDLTGFPGACRIHRAEALRLRGDWPAAEAQALEACEELHDFDHYIAASGRYEIGEIRRRRGDFAEAEEAFRVVERDGPRSSARPRPLAPRRGQDRRCRRGDRALAARYRGPALTLPSSPCTGRDRDRLGRSQDAPGRPRTRPRDRRLVQDRKPASSRVRRDAPPRAWPDSSRGEGLGRAPSGRSSARATTGRR